MDLVGEPEVKSHLEDPGVDGRIVLKEAFKKLVVFTFDSLELLVNFNA